MLFAITNGFAVADYSIKFDCRQALFQAFGVMYQVI